MTDLEKLGAIEEYVQNMFPIVRTAILRSPEDQLVDHGYDTAMRRVQRDLEKILRED